MPIRFGEICGELAPLKHFSRDQALPHTRCAAARTHLEHRGQAGEKEGGEGGGLVVPVQNLTTANTGPPNVYSLFHQTSFNSLPTRTFGVHYLPVLILTTHIRCRLLARRTGWAWCLASSAPDMVPKPASAFSPAGTLPSAVMPFPTPTHTRAF